MLIKNPDCSKCRHFYITLDERHPKACRMFNIKGKNIPAIDVRRFTGHVCPVFEERHKPVKKIKTTDSILDTFA